MDTADENASDSETDGTHEVVTDEMYEKLKEEIHETSRELGISLEEATRHVYGSHGLQEPRKGKVVESISDLKPGMGRVTVKARIISVHQGTRQGGEGIYHYGLLGDSDSDVRFSAWSEFPFRPGSAIIAQNVRVREWNGKLEVVINKYSTVTVTEETDDLIPQIEEGVPSLISELEYDSKNVDLEGRILDLRKKSVKVKGSERTVIEGLIADRSGRIEFTCWGPLDIQKDACYRIIGGYVKPFKGRLFFNFDAGCIIREISDSALPPAIELKRPNRIRIADLESNLMAGPVEIHGTVVSLRPGSGLVRKCADCGRRKLNGQCPVHGRSETVDDLRLRAVFDDGTDTLMLRGDRKMVEEMLETDMDSMIQRSKDEMDTEWAEVELRRKLIGHPVVVTGDPVVNDYGTSVSLDSLVIEPEIEEMKGEIVQLMEVMS
mgnify:CR=1 FL=1